MSSTLAATVSKIRIPKNQLLLGIHPILAIHFQTDDPTNIIELLNQLTSKEANKLIEEVKSTIQSSLYPHKQSVWMFNDPSIEIEMLTQALIHKNQDASFELEGVIEIHYDTYPFIETLCEPLIYQEDIVSDEEYLENPSRIDETALVQKSVEDKGVNPLGAIFIPTAALGSLYILSKIAKE